VLGTGIQTARKAVDDGLIGAPISALAILGTPGPERWHPNPDFYYLPGGGPLLDMGPYYISALVTLLGPVASVIGAASHTRDTRRINAGPREGEIIPVSTDTHVTGVLMHASGALSTLYMSFDTVATVSARIEVHGEQGSLVVPDPNTFAGDVRLRTLETTEWQTLPVSAGYVDSSRGFGVHDLARTAEGREPRAGGRLAFHVLDVMESLLVSARAGRVVVLESTCERPAPHVAQPLDRFGRSALVYPKVPLVRYLASRPRPFRVIGIGSALFPNANVFAGVEDVRTHDPMERRDYVAFLDATCGYPPDQYFKFVRDPNAPVLDFLNVAYAVASPESPPPA